MLTARKRSLGQGNIFTPVCHSVYRGDYLGRYPRPPGRYTHLGPGTPTGTRYTPDQVHPLPQAGTPLPPIPGTPPTPRTRYTPRDQVHPPGPGTPPRQVHPPDQVHLPPGSSACWEIRATSGRYASYWNAFLF